MAAEPYLYVDGSLWGFEVKYCFIPCKLGKEFGMSLLSSGQEALLSTHPVLYFQEANLNDLSGGAIAGITIVVLVIVAAGTVFAIYFIKKGNVFYTVQTTGETPNFQDNTKDRMRTLHVSIELRAYKILK